MRLLIIFARRYPLRSLVMVLALILAGFMEGIGLSMLLPLITITVGTQSGEQNLPASEMGAADSTMERLVADAFSTLNLSPTVGLLLIVIIAAVILKSGMMLIAKTQVGFTVARVSTDLRLELLRSLMASRWQYFVKQPLGGLANAMASETNRASKAYMSGVLMTTEFFQALVYFLMAFLVSWKATFISLTAGCAILYLVKRFLKKARKAGIKQTVLRKSLIALLIDTLQSIKPLKSMARESVSDLLLEKKTKGLNKALQKQVLSKEFLKAFQEILMTVFLVAGLYILLIYWHMSVASVMVLVFLVSRLLKQLNKVQERYQEMIIFESAYWSLKGTISSVQKECEVLGGDITPVLTQAVRMEHVEFAYDEDPVLQGISLDFPVGQITTIVGPSGSGKTTLVDLATGLLRPSHGEVWIDDSPLGQVNLKKWRSMIGYIPQETLLLNDTVLNNVTLCSPGLTEADAKEALQAAGAWAFVKKMPQAMQSIVGERGGILSGGQRQRIAIARALVHKPLLLILDEATSSLDPESEEAICETLQQLRGNLTILAISHQAALVKIADHAYRMEDGQIVAQEDDSENPFDSLKFDDYHDHRQRTLLEDEKSG